MDKLDFAWGLYQSERDFIKHHENQRTNASSILAAIYAALVVAIGTGTADGWLQVVISIVLTLVGVYGTIFSGKLYELIQMHAARSYEYLDFVNSCFPEIDVSEVKAKVKVGQAKKYPYFSTRSLNKIWFRFHLSVAGLGAVITIVLITQQLGLWSLVLKP
jgi:hypothetical protein